MAQNSLGLENIKVKATMTVEDPCKASGHVWARNEQSHGDITWNCQRIGCGAYIVDHDQSGRKPPPGPFARQEWVESPDGQGLIGRIME